MANSSDDIRDELSKQISDLKKEVTKLGEALASRASDAGTSAGDIFDEGRRRAREASHQVQDQTRFALDTARKNPATTAIVLSVVGLAGLTVGMALCGLLGSDERGH